MANITSSWGAITTAWGKTTQGVNWEFVPDVRYDGGKLYVRAAVHNMSGNTAYTGTNKSYRLQVWNSAGTSVYDSGTVAYGSTIGANTWVHLPSDNGTAINASAGGTYKVRLTWTVISTAGTSEGSGTCLAAPSGLALSVTGRTYNSFTANTTVGNWGGGSSQTRVFKVLQSVYAAGVSALGKKSTSTSTGAVALTVSRSGADDIVGTAFDIKGASGYYIGLWASASGGEARLAPTTVYYTPPAPLASVTKTSSSASSTANSITHTISITGGSTSVNSTNAVTTQYRYSTNGGSSYTNWTNISGTASPQTAKTFTFTSVYGASCAVQARQVYQSQYSETKTLTFTAQAATAPSGLSVSCTGTTKNTVTLKASVSSYGTPSSINGRKLAIGIRNTKDGAYKRENQISNVTSGTTTVDNNSIYPSSQPLNIQANTKYTPYLWAWNGVTSSTLWGTTDSVVTLPPDLNSFTAGTPVQTSGGSTFTVTISYAYTKAGSAYTEYLKYKVNSGSETSVTAATSGTITLSNLAPKTTYTVTGYLGTTAGNGASKTVTFTTPASYKVYVPVNGKSKMAKKAYVSVSGKTKLVKKIYASVSGKAKRIF